MNNSLFMEFSNNSVRLVMYTEDNCFVNVDITGGYGSIYIPLMIHYIDDDIFIGEDALTFDLEEISRFAFNINDEDNVTIADYICVLIDKIHNQTPYKKIDRLIFVESNGYIYESFNNALPKLVHKKFSIFKSIELIGVLNKDAIAGYAMEYGTDFDIAIFDQYKISKYSLSSNNNKIQLLVNDDIMDFTVIDKYYLNKLALNHYERVYDELELLEQHKLSQLYKGQQVSLHKQFAMNKNVNIYSSITFPPKKITLDYDEFQQTYTKVNAQYNKNITNWIASTQKTKFMYCGIGQYISLIKSFKGETRGEIFNENLLVEGGFIYLKYLQTNINILEDTIIGYNIGLLEHGEFIPLIRKEYPLTEIIDIDILITDNQTHVKLYTNDKEEIKLVGTIDLTEILRKYRVDNIIRIGILMKMNQNKEIKEVNYELRKL